MSLDKFNLPSSMRALEYASARNFSVVTKALPPVRPHDVLIKVKACGVCGTDVHIHHGEFGAVFPLVPGHETVGVVAAFGSAVSGFAVGDRVVADNSEVCASCHYCRRGQELFCERFVAHGVVVDGGFAEYAAYPAHRVFSLRGDALTDADATLLEPAACAAHGLDRIAPAMGSTVLVLGAGPTGLVLAQMLRANGGCRTVLAAPPGPKLDVARSLQAADEFVELPRDAAASAQALAALRRDNPYGFDIVVEATGSAAVLAQAIDYVAKAGTLVVYGVYNDADTVAFAPNKIFKAEITILGSFSQTHKFPAALDYLTRGRVAVTGIVNKTYRIEQWQECLDAMANKTVIKAAIVFD
ncbi:alcohol dehydrogenase, zinc-containing [Sporothrix brasiliensis 5110]|uniref:Alcohol dehydrogenase, zinc-containing n=1 Tax=Sporothrix brasiliensis 5110 TaxID=1398154 RepID=A0A0C2IN70_9PEZI|nr:alcohol dehydrogenase, zinc-containing [Sporothrix brasiliensis 5110]KIH86477.1 alcohol dehydrogenase, zinc-containing [Sporothrix brasiliensis 5110]